MAYGQQGPESVFVLIKTSFYFSGRRKIKSSFNKLDHEAGVILVLMDNFNNLWNDIYKTEISQEVQKISKTVKAFEIDNNAIDYLVKECNKKDRPENLSTKPMILWPLYNKRCGINTITSVASVLLIWNVFHTTDNNNTGKYLTGNGCIAMVVVALQYNYVSRKIKSRVLDHNLSKLSRSSIEMNTRLKNFGILVSMEARRVQADTGISHEGETENYSAAFDIEIDSLIRIAQNLRHCLESIQQQTSQNESNARKLVLKCNPDFLVKN
ncbi:hypothetical protein BDF21DRAFT_394836 [Thamnidium elegans]|nr:hypothetical protein BDF21DRAFT_394836 [Thamnidium elegans]